MSKITLQTVNDGGSASGTSIINQNFAEIVEAIENTLSRDGTIPNQLTADVDTNSNDILNVNNIDTVTLFINGVDVHEVVGIQGPVGPPGPGDMLKSVYDPTDINSSPFARANHTGTQAQSTVTSLVSDLALKAPLASPAFTGTPTGITKTHVGLSNVDNTADTAKPVSTAQQTALDLKANLASPTFTGTVAGITKTMVGLGSVDNTADTAKPVSTAQQTALDLKANLASPTLTGTPAAPTAAVNTSTTQLATTAFVETSKVPQILTHASGASINLANVDVVNFNTSGTLSITGFSNGVIGKTYIFRNLTANAVTITRSSTLLDGGTDKVLNINNFITLMGTSSAVLQQVAPVMNNS